MDDALSTLCKVVRTHLAHGDDPAAREKIRASLASRLVDTAFQTQVFTPDAPSGKRQLHRDPDQGFCVLAYDMHADRESPPHDHGPTWAVYGQVRGETEMTIWALDPNSSSEGLAPTRRFTLAPGEAGLFDIGEIHSIRYAAGARFVRITGEDLEHAPRRLFDAQTGAARTHRGSSAGGTAQASAMHGTGDGGGHDG